MHILYIGAKDFFGSLFSLLFLLSIFARLVFILKLIYHKFKMILN